MRKRPFQILGIIGLVLGTIWEWWGWILDEISYAVAFLGLIASPVALRASFDVWLKGHPHLANEYGPFLLLILATGIFFTPNLQPWVKYLVNRYSAPKDIEEAKGSSVSITVPSGITAVFRGGEDSMMAFQPFRFVNISTTRPRQLDVEITADILGNGNEGLIFRSSQDGKTPYQRKVEEILRHDRRLRCISFPLRLEPNGIEEGQIIVSPPREWDDAPLGTFMDRSSTIKFKFREHYSGRDVELRMGEYFDATKGETLFKRPALSKLAHWSRALSKYDSG